MSESFKTDPKIAKIAEAYALDAIDFATSNFGVRLDWSDGSVKKVEEILGQLHDDVARSKPPEEAVWTFAGAFDSYVGEVLRKRHGGEWGMVTLNGQEFPGIRQDGDRLCWPWGRAHNRIVKGPAENVYQVLLKPSAGSQSTGLADEPRSKPWWRFW